VAFHTNLGPDSGHCPSSPVSLDTPSRSGPRHCGQSAPKTVEMDKTIRSVLRMQCLIVMSVSMKRGYFSFKGFATNDIGNLTHNQPKRSSFFRPQTHIPFIEHWQKTTPDKQIRAWCSPASGLQE
jgi:hypothetical protein